MWSKTRSAIFRLRVEEFLAFLFFLPMSYFTFKAYFFFKSQGHIPNAIQGGVARWIITILVFFLFLAVIKFKPEWKIIRDGLPFGFCIAIYTNLHDTIHFANPHDIHGTLIKIDNLLFGVQPCVWAEQFVHPVLTDFFTFFYVLYFLWAPLLAFILYLKDERMKFRYTLVGVILAYYIGYLGYVLFPAASPHVVLASHFTKTLQGLPFLDQVRNSIEVVTSTSRDAFPSLHTGAILVALFFAWRYVRWYFWLVLPFALGMILSTIYLRQHYLIDLIAGWVLAHLAVWLGPKVERGWARLQNSYSRVSSEVEPGVLKTEGVKT